MAEEKIKGIIRLMDKDIGGNTKVLKSLIMINGVKFGMANAICTYLNLDKGRKIGSFSPEELKTVEDLIKHPENKFPSWLLNRRKDPETGEDKHLSGTGLKMRKEFDIKFMRKIKSYKGIRHSMGQPVRGQRTRAHFRTSGKSLGVTKKSAVSKKV